MRRFGIVEARTPRFDLGSCGRTRIACAILAWDRELRARQLKGHLFRGDGLLHQPRALAEPARHQVLEPDLHRHLRGP